MESEEYLEAAAIAVERQAMDNPGIGIPADPDIAEHMGIFVEDALSEQDVLNALDISLGPANGDLAVRPSTVRMEGGGNGKETLS
jgi:hypothetical protein